MIIEGTTRCTLGCPGCPRTWFSDTFDRAVPKHDLDIDALERFLDCESGKNVRNFSFNGNHGDVIYYPHLFDLLERFRNNKSYRISTNGSHQKESFWHRLREILTEDDTLMFSIDGLEHDNHLYRRNSDWKSIMSAIEIMQGSRARLVWKTLVFSYNEHEIDEIKKFAEDRGMIFRSDYSSRFGDDSLIPNDHDKILHDRRYQKFQDIELDPKCKDLEYISAEGYYWPCCMISSYYTLHKTWLWKERDRWRIDDQTLDDAREKLYELSDHIRDNPKTAHEICQMHCKKGQFEYPWGSI